MNTPLIGTLGGKNDNNAILIVLGTIYIAPHLRPSTGLIAGAIFLATSAFINLTGVVT
jgi:hypothetical protein